MIVMSGKKTTGTHNRRRSQGELNSTAVPQLAGNRRVARRTFMAIVRNRVSGNTVGLEWCREIVKDLRWLK